MPNTPNIHLRPMTSGDRPAVLELAVTPEQNSYVSPVAEMLARLGPGEEPHLVECCSGDRREIAGFFIIDERYWHKYSFVEPGEIGLLGYFIDANRQGQGLGKAGIRALQEYLRAAYPGASAVILTVNARNPAAIHAYLTGGFEDTGQQYLGGRSGPQHIMRMSLHE